MSDESPRSTHGNPSFRRPSDAPSWWADLDRPDLPDDETGAPRSAIHTVEQREWTRHGGAAPAVAVADEPEPAPMGRLRSIAAVLTVVLAALAIAWFGIGGGSGRSLIVVILLFGVPGALAAGVVALAARRVR